MLLPRLEPAQLKPLIAELDALDQLPRSIDVSSNEL